MDTITLTYPVTLDGQEFTALTIRRPKVRDLRAVERQGGGDIQQDVRLFANLCEVSPETIEALDLQDYRALGRVYDRFFLDEAASPAAPR